MSFVKPPDSNGTMVPSVGCQKDEYCVEFAEYRVAGAMQSRRCHAPCDIDSDYGFEDDKTGTGPVLDGQAIRGQGVPG